MRKESGVLFLFILIVSFVSASHSASNVYLNLNGQNIDLQSAIDAGNFTRSYTGGDYSGDIIFGHKASEIIINVNGTVKNLSSALSDGSFMKATSGKSPANYTGYNFIYGEYASNISVIINGVEKNLQEAVNQSNFYVCVPNCACSTNTCNGSTCSDGCGRICEGSKVCKECERSVNNAATYSFFYVCYPYPGWVFYYVDTALTYTCDTYYYFRGSYLCGGVNCFDFVNGNYRYTINGTYSKVWTKYGWKYSTTGNYVRQSTTFAIIGYQPYADSYIVCREPVASYTLSLIKNGEISSGTISSNPTGITCGAGCSFNYSNYNNGTSVVLTATPSPSHIFTGWSGDCSGIETCTILMNQSKSVNATFN